jgi:hypothetical protein
MTCVNLTLACEFISQHVPISEPVGNNGGAIRRRDALGGIIHEYYRQPQAPISIYGENIYAI